MFGATSWKPLRLWSDSKRFIQGLVRTLRQEAWAVQRAFGGFGTRVRRGVQVYVGRSWVPGCKVIGEFQFSRRGAIQFQP
eukprot:7738701-Alexandrium_andersonii.AAC.1